MNYRRMPLVKYRQYVNNPTISAGSPIVKMSTRSSSMLEIRIRANSGEYSVYLSSKVTSPWAGVAIMRSRSFIQRASAATALPTSRQLVGYREEDGEWSTTVVCWHAISQVFAH
jgi:hypothetical protein